MNRLNRNTVEDKTNYDINVVQFGEGNFLRVFVDFAFYKLNEKTESSIGVAVVQPIDRGLVQMLNEQDGLYTLFTKGYSDGQVIEEKYVVNTIVKGINPYESYSEYLALAKLPTLEFIISNTTEAGITYVHTDRPDMQPPSSFPAKLAVLLHERYQHFKGSADAGLAIIPCELINYNADTLKSIILKYAALWELQDGFSEWIEQHNTFHNTLVDRIVPGYPKDDLDLYQKEMDYEDNLLVTAEHFFLWVIEGGDTLKSQLPFDQTGLDVKIVSDMQPYRTRKVRILNGAHTSMVPFGLLYGHKTVKETIDDPFTGNFVKELLSEEIIPTLDLPKEELVQFANDVLDRFRNPFIKHNLSSIALNSISKFKVRVLPSLLQYQKMNGVLPQRTIFAFACLIRFYKGTWNGKQLPVNDDEKVVAYFEKLWNTQEIPYLVDEVLRNKDIWGENLTEIPRLSESITKTLQMIEIHGIEQGFIQLTKK